MYFEFEQYGTYIDDSEIDEVVKATIHHINEEEEDYSEETIQEMAETVIQEDFFDCQIGQYYDIIKHTLLDEIYKRVSKKLKERGE